MNERSHRGPPGADFKTAQGVLRPGGLNTKGVFTRDRWPKMAAHFRRERWGES
jgi:beta-glucuronidase